MVGGAENIIWCTNTLAAHVIRNYNTSTAQATAALQATSRWAISGTPLQNSLTDFLGLFKFLHFAPYDDAKVFDNDISDMWRSKPAEEAVETFKSFLSCIMIRRTKRILKLPPREDHILRLPFNYHENEHYRRIEKPVMDMLDQTANEENNTGSSWMTALQQINKLRLVCVLGTFVPLHQPRLSISKDDGHLEMLAARFSLGGEMCMQCLQPIETSSNEIHLGVAPSPRVYHSACSLFFCADCAGLLLFKAPEPCGCKGRSSSCFLRSLAPSLPTPNLTPCGDSPFPTPSEDSPLLLVDSSNAFSISSKIQALIVQIKGQMSEKQ
jgi:hypothetical protein